MKVYVLTIGHATYEDNVQVKGVFRKEEDAKTASVSESSIHYDDAKWGDYWYNIEEWEVK